MMLAFLACWLLIYFSYSQLFESKTRLFWLLSISYVLITLSWSIHSMSMIIYDIKSQIEAKWFIDKIDESDFKEWRYEFFLKHTFISWSLQVLLMIWNSLVSFFVDDWISAWYWILLNILTISVNVWFLFLLYKTLDRIIDYEMDFNIFTIDQFIIYRQHWFFKTESMNIATSTVKIVQESKSWLFWSLFSYWKVSIHPEGSLWTSKSIELYYVPSPKRLAKKLNEFIDKSKEWMNISTAS